MSWLDGRYLNIFSGFLFLKYYKDWRWLLQIMHVFILQIMLILGYVTTFIMALPLLDYNIPFFTNVYHFFFTMITKNSP